jgi:hypothetical protein
VADELGGDRDRDAALLEAGDERVSERVQPAAFDPDLGERRLPGGQHVAPRLRASGPGLEDKRVGGDRGDADKRGSGSSSSMRSCVARRRSL